MAQIISAEVKVERLKRMTAIGQIIASKLELKPLIKSVVEESGRLVKVDRSTLWLCDDENQKLYTFVGDRLKKTIHLPMGQGLVGMAVENHDNVNIANAYTSQFFDRQWDIENRYRTCSVLCLPMTKRGKVIACLQFINKLSPEGREIYIPCENKTIKVVPFLEEDQTILRNVADLTAVAIENALAFQELQRMNQKQRLMNEGTNVAFAKAVDARDRITGDHTKMVTAISVAIAKTMGLDEQTIELVRIAATLHDVGKIGIPDMILNKPGKFTSAERSIMEQHAIIGRRILEDIPWSEGLENVALWATGHHERMDGSGYPDGLKAGNISLVALIIAVADVYQALTQKRPYKEAMNPQKAYSICLSLTKFPKHHLDVNVVKYLGKVLEGCGYDVNKLANLAGW